MSSVKTNNSIDEIIESINKKNLVLYNDDVNSFHHVIFCLVVYCKHSFIQAEQCANIVHNNGKCSIKTSSIDDLIPIYNALLENKLTVKIE